MSTTNTRTPPQVAPRDGVETLGCGGPQRPHREEKDSPATTVGSTRPAERDGRCPYCRRAYRAGDAVRATAGGDLHVDCARDFRADLQDLEIERLAEQLRPTAHQAGSRMATVRN